MLTRQAPRVQAKRQASLGQFSSLLSLALVCAVCCVGRSSAAGELETAGQLTSLLKTLSSHVPE